MELRGGTDGTAIVPSSEIIAANMHEHPAGIVHAERSDSLENHVLADTFFCGLGIFHYITATAVQQSMTSAGRAVGKVLLLQQYCGNPPKRKVPENSCPGSASTYDYDLCFFHGNRLHDVSSPVQLRAKRGAKQ